MATSRPQVLAITGLGIAGVVTNYSSLPPANLHGGENWMVLNEEGTRWLLSYHNKGQYYSDGTSWITCNVPVNASQSIVNTGTDDEKFVTSSTLSNSVWAFTVAKVLATALTGLNLTFGGAIVDTDTILQAFGKLQYQITELNTIYATLASPNFTGTPTAPTPLPNDNSTKIATTEYVDTASLNDMGIDYVFSNGLYKY